MSRPCALPYQNLTSRSFKVPAAGAKTAGARRAENGVTVGDGETEGGGEAAVDWMELLERAVAARPHATPADIRRAAPALRDWADKRLAKHIVLARHRLAARQNDGG